MNYDSRHFLEILTQQRKQEREMKASELRCGNHVLDYEGYTIETIQPSDFALADEDGDIPFQPIPLTEEWLLKFGFQPEKVYESVFDYWIADGYHTKGHKVQTDGDVFVFMGYKDGTEIKYVHQLQNLFYSLTGTELTIKE